MFGRVMVVLALLALQFGTACQRASQPDRVVRKFVQALNDKDINVLLACVDPKQERMFRATFQIIEKMTGFPVENMLEAIPGLSQLFQNEKLDDFSFSEIKIADKTINKDEAEVTVSLLAIVRSRGISRSERQTVQFLLREFETEGWRITSIRSIR